MTPVTKILIFALLIDCVFKLSWLSKRPLPERSPAFLAGDIAINATLAVLLLMGY